MKILVLLISFMRMIRASFATFILKNRVVHYGSYVGAARIPHIGSGARVEIGSHCGFNGITISGWGGKNRELFSLRNKCEDYAG